jgi:hypothetical protein
VFDGKYTLSLTFDKAGGGECSMLLEVTQNDVLRMRFNPNKKLAGDYARGTRVDNDKTDGSGVQVVIFAVRLLTVKGVYL